MKPSKNSKQQIASIQQPSPQAAGITRTAEGVISVGVTKSLDAMLGDLSSSHSRATMKSRPALSNKWLTAFGSQTQ